tara:strand:- start:9597 stop:10730 length:1134 start_codon:yes stop_codon:yes gene_type:complete
MAITNEVITNRLDKKVNYGLTRTDFNSNKTFVNESIPSPIPNPTHNLWMESHLIPDGVTGWNSGGNPQPPPSTNDGVVGVYQYNANAQQGNAVGEVYGVYELTCDPSVGSRRSWLVSETPGDPYAPLLTNWIRSSYGAGYLADIVVGPCSSSAVSVAQPLGLPDHCYGANSGASNPGGGLGSGNHNLSPVTYRQIFPVTNNQEYYFDTEAGTLVFAGNNLPNNVSDTGYAVYIKKAYQYVGRYGLSNADWNSYIDYSLLDMPTVEASEVDYTTSPSTVNFTMPEVTEFQFDSTAGFVLTDVSTTNPVKKILKVSLSGVASAEITLSDILADPTVSAGTKKVYSKAIAGGGTGLYVSDGAIVNELVSKSKSIIYGLIF